MGLLDSFSGGEPQQMSPAYQGLLAFGLGLLAHNRGLTSGTQALGLAGQEGMGAYAGALQTQQERAVKQLQMQQLGMALREKQLRFDTAQNLLRADQAASAGMAGWPAASMPGPVGGPAPGAGVPGMGGVGGAAPGGAPGIGGAAPGGMAAAPGAGMAPSGGAPMTAPARSPMFGNIPNSLAAFGLMNDPNELFKIAAGQYAPTDLQKQMTAAGIQQGSQEWNDNLRGAIKKSNYIAPAALQAGGAALLGDGRIVSTPAAPPQGFQNVLGPGGQWYTVPVPGGTAAMTDSSAATARGQAQYNLTDVFDERANGGKGGMVRQTVANVADAANGGGPRLPAPLRNNNPGALSPGGKLAQYPDLRTGMDRMYANLGNYAKQNVTTLRGAITKWAPPNENDTEAYIRAVSQRLSLDPDAQIDLSDPAVQHAVGMGIMLQENGPRAFFGRRAPAAPQSGPMAAAPPMGVPAGANASQTAAPEGMQQSYLPLQAARASAPALIETYTKMLELAKNKPDILAGPLGSSAALTWFDKDAAEFEKLRANAIAESGRSMGGNNTDAARALMGDAMPDYGKPKPAIVAGVSQQLNQVLAVKLKADLLTPAYNAGDSQTYTALSNAFDQAIKPSLMPQIQALLTMTGPKQREAVQAARKQPGMAPALDLLTQAGVLPAGAPPAFDADAILTKYGIK